MTYATDVKSFILILLTSSLKDVILFLRSAADPCPYVSNRQKSIFVIGGGVKVYIQSSNFGAKTVQRCAYKSGKYNLCAHMHQFSEVMFVKEGEIEVTVDGVTEVAAENDIVIISPFSSHSYTTKSHCKVWLSVFSNDLISDFINEKSEYTSSRGAIFHPTDELIAFIEKKLPDTKEVQIYYSEQTKPQFKRLKSILYPIYEEYESAVPIRDKKPKKELLSEILLWINAHYKENVSLDDVANALGYTSGYVSHRLKQIDNLNFRGIVNSFRVEEAKILLGMTKKRIIDIAIEVGFMSERSFHRTFLALTGVTPGEYRTTRWHIDKDYYPFGGKYVCEAQ